MISRKMWAGLGAGTLTVALGVGAAAAVLPYVADLPLRPLAVDGPGPDDLEHVLVRVPANAAMVAVGGAPPAPPPTGAVPGLDLAELDRYAGRVRALERSGDRVHAVLTDGTRVDVTAGVPPRAPIAPAEPADERRVPAPLQELAADPAVTEVSRVDAHTWRVVGEHTAAQVHRATGLAATEDLLLHIDHTDDTYGPLLWGLDNPGGRVGGYPAARDADVDGIEAMAKETGAGVTVAVVDTGMQLDHPDLPRLWRNAGETCGDGVDDDGNGYVDDCDGWDFARDDATVYDAGDNNDHATHIAGTIAAVPGNDRGVAGLAPGVTIMPLKVSTNGSLLMSDIAEAIRYAVDNGAHIINASFGTDPGQAPRAAVRVMEDAIAYARSNGVLVAAAAGNDGTNTDNAPVWPADLPLDNIVSVGASTADEKRAAFSNYGTATVDLFAPGHYIVSTVPGGEYAAMQGTSMAAPHVAAAAAAVLAQHPSLTPDALRQRLLDTADPQPAYAGRALSGARLNADRALAIDGETDPSVLAEDFHEFRPGTEHTGTLTVSASPELAPADALVTWQGSLLTAVDGATYAVVDQPIAVDGVDTATDERGRVLLGPAAGVRADDPALTTDGVGVRVATTLPAGDYALVVDVVAAADRRFAYGRSVAVFFTVAPPAAEGGTPPATVPTTVPGTPGTPGLPHAPGVPGAPVVPASPGSSASPGVPGTPAPPTSTTPGGGTPSPGTPGGTPGRTPASTPARTPASTPPGTRAPTPAPTRTPPTVPGRPGTPVVPTVPGTPAPGTSTSPGAVVSRTPATSRPPTGVPPSVTVPDVPDPVTGDGITISSVTPNHGPATGGTRLTIVGSGFPGSPVVTIGGRPAPVLDQRLASIVVETPGGQPGVSVDVTVADRGDRRVTMRDAFRYDGTAADPGDGGNGTPAPGASTPAATGAPARPGAPTGPAGSTYRPAPTVGAPTLRDGLRLARILSDDPLAAVRPGQWPLHRCVTATCRAVGVR